MRRRFWAAALLVLGLLAGAGLARAERTPSIRAVGYRTEGVRPDITVPYLTTGRTAFGAYSVAPRIYSSPVVNDPRYAGAKPVFNLIFWGAVQAFGDRSNGAMPRPR